MKRVVLATLALAAGSPRALAQPAPEPGAEPAPEPAAEPGAEPAPEPAAEPAPDATPAPASADIDLSALGLDPTGSSFDDKLVLYGFADVGYTVLHWSRDLGFTPQDSRTFFVGNLNLYMAKNITPRARALAEVRFTFLPNGHRNDDGTYVRTDADDITNANRPLQWGGIIVERVHVEYDVAPQLTIRAGRWLTPYGIWNIDHGSPAIIAINRPYVIGEQFFPEHQTGLHLFGSHHRDDFKLSYHLTASNGRGGTEAVDDRDNNLALGGSVQLETPWGLRAGASYYRGRYTSLPPDVMTRPETYQEAAFGGDAQLDIGRLHVQAELIVRDRRYDEGNRAPLGAGLAPDSRIRGFYVLAGYRFARLWNVMPFAYAERYDPTGADQHIGLNFRPTGGLVLKLQATRVQIDEGRSTATSGARLFVYGAQASWMF
jgi:hypothetical protein